jgi:deoxyribodipyrimidine photo-lyase
MMETIAIVWLRRDLRTHDHPALSAAAESCDRVVPLFVLDQRLLEGRFASGPRTAFMLGCLRDLDQQLQTLGGGLCIRAGKPEEVLPQLAEELGASEVYWTSDVSPFALERDRKVTETLTALGVEAIPSPGNFCADVSLPRTKNGKPFSVFTPFWKAERELPRRPVLGPPKALRLPDGLDCGELPAAPQLSEQLREPFCQPGEPAARSALEVWLDGPIDSYAELHDNLSGGTSDLSPWLRWGCISARETEQRAQERGGDGAAAFVRQLAWRDFYAHVLLMFPENIKLEYQAKFRKLEWVDDEQGFAAWCEGQTGYPLVDAGMRQLATTGWMHNRARMVVGSFLTKDLQIDWRRGEQWFEEMLLDAEPSQNNGNWQWIASTGVDPAPYFRRIFNPILQQQRFDPDGDYIRRWVPELAGVPVARLAEPWKMSEQEQDQAGCVIGRDYPAPVVDHAAARLATIERYRAVLPPKD